MSEASLTKNNIALIVGYSWTKLTFGIWSLDIWLFINNYLLETCMPFNIFFLLRSRVYLSKETFLPRDICLIGVNQILETYIPLFIGTCFAIKKTTTYHISCSEEFMQIQVLALWWRLEHKMLLTDLWRERFEILQPLLLLW